MAFFPLVRKNLGQIQHGLFLPADDLVAMHPKLGSDLVDRHFSPDGGQSDLGLEVGTKFCSSGAHGSSLLFLGSPLNFTTLITGPLFGEYYREIWNAENRKEAKKDFRAL